MSYVIATPEMMSSAATDLATIGSNVSAAHMVAAAPTTAILPAAADEVSASIAHMFSQHAASYQSLAGQATAFHEQFVQNLTASAHSYAATEAANGALLWPFHPGWLVQSGIVNELNSIPLLQPLASLRNSVIQTGYSRTVGLVINLGLIILIAPISIPFLLIFVVPALFAI
jgi:hypothetical protein